MDADRRLRALYRLAETAEGDDLVRVQEAIAARRRELELEDTEFSAWTAAAGAGERSDEPAWTPEGEKFRPAPPDAVPVRERRPGERGYRIVGTRKKPP